MNTSALTSSSSPALRPDGLMRLALALQQAARAGEPPSPALRGCNIGLLCESPDSPEAELFLRAAAGLGAQVARIRPSIKGQAATGELVPVVRMLGRLYDALACLGLPDELVQRLREQAEVPVLAELPDPEDGELRLYLVQARLLQTLTRA